MTEETPIPPELEKILLDYTVNVFAEQPSDIIGHAAAYFTRLKHERDHLAAEEDSSANDGPQKPVKPSISAMLGARNRRRTAVVGEVFDPEKEGKTEIEVFPKSKEETERIMERTKEIFIFKHLSEEDLGSIIHAMRPTEVKEGQIVIQQGEEGDFFYVVEKGTFDAFIQEDDGQVKFVKRYQDTGSFGELSLLQNQPRAATVKAATDGLLWAVSRATFTKLVVRSAYEKRRKFVELLNTVPELKPLTEYEKMQVCDALSPVSLKKGHVLFNEGDEGSGMYFIGRGLISIDKDSGVHLAKLKAGEYFGEMALVKSQPRAGTATALEDSELAFLDVRAFERLLGPSVEVMKEKMDAYTTPEQ